MSIATGWAATIKLPLAEPIWGFGFTNALPGLRFEQPVGVVTPKGETNSLFVVERAGRIVLVRDLSNPTSRIFLDLRDSTRSLGEEEGLLGLAFHPDYARNGRFFVYRTVMRNGFRDELAEFRRDPGNPETADRSSETILISQRDEMNTHNAGDLKFGPDGFLYLSLGDEKPPFEDAHPEPQAIDKGFFSGIIRIDVDGRETSLPANPHPAVVGDYRVPRDNPFVGVREFQGRPVEPGRVRTEFFAIGFRNPWRFTFDPATGAMICADVGGAAAEEVNLVEKGGNYGWPYREGSQLLIEGAPADLRPPIHEYSHGHGNFEGSVIIGGVVYREDRLPGIRGKYLFGDFSSGNVWAVDPAAPTSGAQWLTARRGIASFGVDPRDGGVLVVNFLKGTIEKLVYQDPAASGVPSTLSQVNAFDDLSLLRPRPTVLPYEVIAPLWSDGAFKQRWVNLDGAGEKIRFAPTEPWTFPAGAVWLKHFELELKKGEPGSRRRLETRLLVQTTNGVYGLTYKWDDSQTNAYLLPPYATNQSFLIQDGGITRTQVWTFPGREQCRTCHAEKAGGILSFNTYQLNRSIERGLREINQLSWLAAHELFENPGAIQPEKLPKLATLDDEFAPPQHRVRSYLFSNCANCHQPGEMLLPRWDARISTPLNEAGILGARSSTHPGLTLIQPGDPAGSFLAFRVASRQPLFQMPPLATAEVDWDFVGILTNWIAGMPDPNWASVNLGTALLEGAAERTSSGVRISSTGEGIDQNSCFFYFGETSGSTELAASIPAIRSRSVRSEAGLMLRRDLELEGPYAAAYLKGDSAVFQIRTADDRVPKRIGSMPARVGARLKLLKEGAMVSAWVSNGFGDWALLGRAEWDAANSIQAGFFAAASASGAEFALADFDSCVLNSVELVPPPGEFIPLPRVIPLEANVSLAPETNGIVRYFASGIEIGASTNAPWSFRWQTPFEGSVPVVAVLETAGGSITSAPVVLELAAPASDVWIHSLDTVTLGDWRNRYGSQAYLVPGYATNNSTPIQISARGAEPVVIGTSREPMALETGGQRILSLLRGKGTIEILLNSSDFELRKASLYFMDWLGLGAEQRVLFLDESGGVMTSVNVNCERGIYLSFVFRGRITVRIENANGTPHLSGIFCDPLHDFVVRLIEPADGSTARQPDGFIAKAVVEAPDHQVELVELWDGPEKIAVFSGPPYQAVVTNLTFGEHLLRAIALNTYGTAAESEPVRIVVLPPESKADFLGVDLVTRGAWKGRYGSFGYWLPGDEKKLPSTVRIQLPAGNEFVFDPASTDPKALERVSSGRRVAACFYGYPELTTMIDLLDGAERTVGFYLLDWEDEGRVTDIQVENPEGGILDQRRITEYGNGKHLLWRVKGRVLFRFVGLTGNAIWNGWFVDEHLGPYDLWRNNTFTPGEVAGMGANFDLADFDQDGFSNAIEYALGYDPRLPQDRPVLRWTYHPPDFAVSISHRLQREEMRLVFETSPNLLAWHQVNPAVISGEPGGDALWVLTSRVSNASRQFIRLRTVAER